MLVEVGGHPYQVEAHPQVPNDQVALNGLHRRYLQLSLSATVKLNPFVPSSNIALATIEFGVDYVSKKKQDPKAKPKEIDTDRLAQAALLVMEEQLLSHETNAT